MVLPNRLGTLTREMPLSGSCLLLVLLSTHAQVGGCLSIYGSGKRQAHSLRTSMLRSFLGRLIIRRLQDAVIIILTHPCDRDGPARSVATLLKPFPPSSSLDLSVINDAVGQAVKEWTVSSMVLFRYIPILACPFILILLAV